VVVAGAGFAGLSAASFLAKMGWDVTVLEKHDQPGGRARHFKTDGFTFDMGPSWYWMPDVFERYFASFGKKPLISTNSSGLTLPIPFFGMRGRWMCRLTIIP